MFKGDPQFREPTKFMAPPYIADKIPQQTPQPQLQPAQMGFIPPPTYIPPMGFIPPPADFIPPPPVERPAPGPTAQVRVNSPPAVVPVTPGPAPALPPRKNSSNPTASQSSIPPPLPSEPRPPIANDNSGGNLKPGWHPQLHHGTGPMALPSIPKPTSTDSPSTSPRALVILMWYLCLKIASL